MEEPAHHETFFRKVLNIAFLYHFIFASPHNPLTANYNPESELDCDPIFGFERIVLPILQGSDEEMKKKLFRNFFTRFKEVNVQHKIQCLKNLLQDFIKQKNILHPHTELRDILIKRSILENINTTLQEKKFFKEVVQQNPKKTLQYISVGEAKTSKEAICQLPVKITIEDVRYFPTDESQSFSMKYHIQGINALPVLWIPKTECLKKF